MFVTTLIILIYKFDFFKLSSFIEAFIEYTKYKSLFFFFILYYKFKYIGPVYLYKFHIFKINNLILSQPLVINVDRKL